MLPSFTYHPDPVASGSIVLSDAVCHCCGERRGYIYTGPVFAAEELRDAICPWCIADGSAAQMFDAEFTDAEGIGGYGRWPAVADDVVQEVATRTPGFSGWQQERWWTCCNDAAEFLGPAGKHELLGLWQEAIPVIRAETGYGGEEWMRFFADMTRDYGPTAYVFRCRHCGGLGGYSDCS
jgi:uncharacterized protein